uniref:Muscarinic acetylcholine receptor n=1 Tax=Nothobranchius furzeri TaxID=105023 RepID=A0A8C6MAR2_NOTFU
MTPPVSYWPDLYKELTSGHLMRYRVLCHVTLENQRASHVHWQHLEISFLPSSRCQVIIMDLTSSFAHVHVPSNKSSGSFQETSTLSESHWQWPKVGHGAFTNSPPNRTLMLPAEEFDPLGGHSVWQVIVIVFLTGSLSLVTVVGNILVLVSFKINKALKTVNNYYLLSLAFADLTIGTLSMNLYTIYIIMDQWALGPIVCDLWLAIDYVASNASVMNLLVISFDRYFSVTRPLTYRAKRTTKRAMTMIGLAWSISFILWAPAILLWQYIVGERTVQPNECYIQFLSEPIITFCTAIAAFYLPVTIMAFLFWKIYQETEKRAKDVQSLKGSGSGSSPTQDQNPGSGAGRNSGQGSNTSKRISLAMLHQISTQSCSSCELNQSSSQKRNKKKVVSAAEMGNPSRCGAFCFQVSSLLSSDRASKRSCNTSTVGDAEHSSCENCISEEAGVSGDGIASEMEADEVDQSQPSTDCTTSTKVGKSKDKEQTPTIRSLRGSNHVSSSSSSAAMTSRDAALAKRFASKAKSEISKRKNEKKANEKKAAQTLSAILFAFIMTWLPYNIMVLVNTFCQDCIPETLWALGYWLCYVNSTVNPMCYALCNKTFRTTFRDILMCNLHQHKNKPYQQREAVAFQKKGKR